MFDGWMVDRKKDNGGWMDGKKEKWTDGWMVRWVDMLMDGWVIRCLNE